MNRMMFLVQHHTLGKYRESRAAAVPNGPALTEWLWTWQVF